MTLPTLLLSLFAWLFSSAPPAQPAVRELADLNDNIRSAGSLVDGVLSVTLRVQEADWRPMGDDQPGATVFAFSEGSAAPSIPGPLLRVREGTRVRVRLENPTATGFSIQGLTSRLQPTLDVVYLAAGATEIVEFTADVEGTYHYWGAMSDGGEEVPDITDRFFEDAVLGGALVVDPSEGPVPDDRIFLMNIYGHRWTTDTPDSEVGELLVINGRPWPFTERVQAELGDTLRWRLINASERIHPMHLHGFYFEIQAKGDLAKDTIYWPSQRRMAVTENMLAGTTLRLEWVPDRPGGWLFHCHLSFHVLPNPVLGDVQPSVEEMVTHLLMGNPEHDAEHHVEQGMGGLMMAVQVHAPDGWAPYEGPRRQLRLLIQSDSSAAPEGASHLQIAAPYRRRFGYVLQEGNDPPAPDSVRLPGSTLVLEQGEPTSIWVVNNTPEASAVHWHGLELDSYFDGVVGVGGIPAMPTPPVMPGDSFEVRITPPRAGSFMYHTHVNDIRQLSGGLYGPIVITEPGEDWDPDHDKVFLLGWSPERQGVFLNGETEPEPLEVVAGETYRFRLMNLTLGNPAARFRVLRDGDGWFWTPVAKDGFDLPAHQRIRARADQQVGIGETMDVEVTFPEEGEYALEARGGGVLLFVRQPITVLAPADASPGQPFEE